MTPERESLIYKDIVRAVLWGSEKEEILHTLQVNDITGDHAEEMYNRARKERIKTLRSEAIQTATKGALLVAGGIALLAGSSTPGRGIFISSVISFFFGGWWMISGIVDIIMAPSKRGSIVD